MHEVLVNRLGVLSLPRKSVVRLTDRPDMTLDVYRGRKTTNQQQQQQVEISNFCSLLAFTFKKYSAGPDTEHSNAGGGGGGGGGHQCRTQNNRIRVMM